MNVPPDVWLCCLIMEDSGGWQLPPPFSDLPGIFSQVWKQTKESHMNEGKALIIICYEHMDSHKGI